MLDEKQENPINNNKGTDVVINPYKVQVFDTFCLWCAIPTMFRGKSSEELAEKFFIDNEEFQDLCAIKNQGQFAEKYGVNQSTLTEWKKVMETRDVYIDIRKWVSKVNKNVVASAYRSAMSKDPKAHQDRKLMLQLGGWSEEQKVNLTGEGLFDILKRGLEIK